MHGLRGSVPSVRCYLCSNRRHGQGCKRPSVKAEPLENQLAQWLRDFQPDADLRARVLEKLTEQARAQDGGPDRRAALADQLRRLQDVYVDFPRFRGEVDLTLVA